MYGHAHTCTPLSIMPGKIYIKHFPWEMDSEYREESTIPFYFLHFLLLPFFNVYNKHVLILY